MGQEILNCFIKTISFILFFISGNVLLHAQNSNTDEDNDEKDTEAVYFPLYNGLTISTDIYGLGANLLGGNMLSSEIAIEADLKNRFFPIVEVGYGTTDTWSERGIHYKNSAPYFRLGMNYNTMYKKGNPNFLYVGLRIAYTGFSYDITNAPVEDPIYGGSMSNPSLTDNIWHESIPFEHQGLKSSMVWYELLVGIRAHIYKNIYMGWSVRLKRSLMFSEGDYGVPWYVPGFGEYGSSRFGLTYSIIYKLPYKK